MSRCREAIQEKVLAIPDHRARIHIFEENQHNKKCDHPIPLPKRKYIAKNSLARQKVKEILMGVNDQRLQDYLLFDEYQHTGMIENINSLHNKEKHKKKFYICS